MQVQDFEECVELSYRVQFFVVVYVLSFCRRELELIIAFFDITIWGEGKKDV